MTENNSPTPAVKGSDKIENDNESKDKKLEEKKEENKSIDNKAKISEIKPGMTVKIYQKIKEFNVKGEEKERIQYFEGMVIAKKHGQEKGATITVRKVSNGVGVEKIFPLNLPTITKIEVKKQVKVRRAKLYFLKNKYKKKLKDLSVLKRKK